MMTGTGADFVRRAADSLLEATVVASWTRLGFLARRRLWSWPPAPAQPMTDRTVLVTGGTRGIGRAAATDLARAGASVGLVGRDPEGTERAAAEVVAEAGRRRPTGGPNPGRVWAEPADIGSLAQVESLAARVAGRVDRLDALVHGAGLLSRSHVRSPDGTELTAAVHVVGPHLLTARLAPLLAAGAPSTVVWVSSGGLYGVPLDVDHLDPPAEGYRGTLAYARAKRAQVELAHLWAERLGPAGVTCVAMHPGWVDTGALRSGLPRFAAALGPLLRSPAEGADTLVWLAGGGAGTGARPALWLDRRPRGEHRWPGTATGPGERDRLWAWCQGRAGLAEAAPR